MTVPKQKPQEGAFYAYETAVFPAGGFLPALFISSFQSRTGRRTAHDHHHVSCRDVPPAQLRNGMSITHEVAGLWKRVRS